MESKPNPVPKVEEVKLKVPHTYVLIFVCIILAAIATYLVPAGVYDRVKDAATGRTLVNPASYHLIKQSPVDFFDVFLAFPKGISAASGIVAFLFIVGGAYNMIDATGTLQAGIFRSVGVFQGREKFLIPASMILFSVAGFSFGMAEETIIFVPMGIAVARSLGFDNVTGTAMISIGAAAGFSSGMLNPFSVGVAHGIAELPMFSGIGFRSGVYVFVLGAAIWYIMRYASRVKADPTASYTYGVTEVEETKLDVTSIPEFNARHKAVLVAITLGFACILYGVTKKDWGMQQIAGAFLTMGIFAGIIGGVSPSTLAAEFVKGAKSLTFGALLVGLARGIVVILEQGKIVDTIVYGMASVLSGLPPVLSAIGMMLVQSVLNFVIPSSSGMAATTLPILIPLGDVIGLTRQTTVLAFQFGDGFTNSIVPTSAALMGYLAVAQIPYERWVRFVAPIILIWTVIGAIAVTVAIFVNYGPF